MAAAAERRAAAEERMYGGREWAARERAESAPAR